MKNQPKTIAFILALSFASLVNAQDTIKVGVNNESITVTPPGMNQKVSITIEDSAYDYRIDIMKLPKGGDLIGKTNNQDNFWINKKPKKFTSRYFDEVELGYTKILANTFHEVKQYGFNSMVYSKQDSSGRITFVGVLGNHVERTFLAQPLNGGFYVNMNIRNKTRPFRKNKNLYFRNATQLKFNHNFFYGDMEYTEYYSFVDSRQDSIVYSDTFQTDITLSNLLLGKRLAIGYVINAEKGFSVEYGLDLGIRLFQYEHEAIYSLDEWTQGNNEMTTQSSNNVFNPNITFYHRLGVNYGRFTTNFGLSYGKREIGSRSYYEGRSMNIGLAYRFR